MFSPPPKKLVIGLPIFNEAGRLQQFLESLKPNVDKLIKHEGVRVEVIACLNGTTDHSRHILEKWNTEHGSEDFPIRIISLPKKGKFRAQRTIAEYAEDRPIIFADSDTILDENCFPALWRNLNNNPNAYVVSAADHPVIPDDVADTPFIRMQRAYYASRTYLPERQYFVAKAFIMRDAVPFYEKLGLKKRIPRLKEGNYLRSKKDGSYLGSARDAERFIHLMALSSGGGPPTDDAYLSLWTVLHYGLNGISEAKDATLKYTPTLTMKDFIDERMRNIIGLRTILWLFPKFNYADELLRSKHLRIIDFIKHRTDISIKPEDLALIEQRTRIVEHMRQFAIQNPLGVLELRKFWRPTSTTKGEWAKIAKEVNGETAPPHSVHFNYVPEDSLQKDIPSTSALAFIFNDEGKMLVVFHKKRGFDIPGGHLKGVREGRRVTETPVQAVVREVYEETGFSSLKSYDFAPIGAMHSDNPLYGGSSYIRAFAARLDNRSPSLTYKSNEVAGCCWMQPEDFMMCHTGAGADIIKQMIQKALKSVFPDKPLSMSAPEAATLDP